MFLFGDAVGDDARTGAGIDVIAFLISQADADAAVHIAGKVDVADGAAVDAAFVAFQFVDDFTGPIFGAPDRVPAGRTEAMASTAVLSLRIVLWTVEPMCMMWEKRRTSR